MNPEIINLKNRPDLKEKAIKWFSSKWGIDEIEYRKSFDEMYSDLSPIPLWFVILGNDGEIAAGCGIIENDFVDRTDLKPYLCALFVEPQYRGNALGGKLLFNARKEAKKGGFENIYLCTDHIGYYEKYGWEYIAIGNHPWGETSRIYQANTKTE